MPVDGQYVICDKCSIWYQYHPECEGLEINQIPKSGISYYCKKMVEPKTKEEKIKKIMYEYILYCVLRVVLQLSQCQKKP